MLGEQVAGVGRAVFELATQLDHVVVQGAGALPQAGTPHAGQQLTGADELTRALQQPLQDRPFGGREPGRLARHWDGRGVRAGYPVRGQVELPSPDDHQGLAAQHGALVAAQRRAQPG